ncbi:MAG: hypothetical protein AAFX40_01850 [Cyanobacteria bacterium J06639_1]
MPRVFSTACKRFSLVGMAILSGFIAACDEGVPGSSGPDVPMPLAVTGTPAATIDVAGAELLDVTPNGSSAVVVGGTTLSLVQIGASSLTPNGTLELPEANFPDNSTAAEFTGTAISPDGSFALVGVKDDDDANVDVFNEQPGKVIAVSLPGLEVLAEVTVGIGPDSVAIASDGTYAAVANEDEEDETSLPGDRPGSVSIIDLRNGPSNLSLLTTVAIPPDGIPFFAEDPQPETVTIAPDSSFMLVTLQENNAIARIDVNTFEPGGLSVTSFDAGQRSGEGFVQGGIGDDPCLTSNGYADSVLASFTSSREPDGIAISPDGSVFVTADEDNVAVAESGGGSGDPFGARSISVFDATSGALLGDSGNQIETAVVDLSLPQRCEDKGPEPEVVDVGTLDGRTVAFVSLERSDAVGIFDISDPSDITLLDTVILTPDANDAAFVVGNDEEAQLEPEGIVFIPGSNQVVVSNPENETMTLVNLTVGDQ